MVHPTELPQPCRPSLRFSAAVAAAPARCLTQFAKLISSLVWRAQPALHTARSSASRDQRWLIPTEVLL